MYKNSSTWNKVFLVKQLYNLHMPKGGSVASHLNEFNIVVSKLASVKVKIEEEMKDILLLCSLPDSWERLVKYISNIYSVIYFNDTMSAILGNEIQRKSIRESSFDVALIDRGK